MKRYLVGVMVLGMVLGTGVWAKEPGESGAAFLKVGQSVRTIALGGAGSALADDLSAIFINPAGLAQISQREVSLLYSTPLNEVDDLSMSLISGAMPTSCGVLGGGVIYYGYGKTAKYTAGNTRDGDWSASDLAIIGSYAKEMQKNLLCGVNIKLIQEKIDDSSGSAFSADLGLIYKGLYPGLSLAGVIQNLGTELKLEEKGSPLPLTIKTGLAYQMPNLPACALLDITLPNNNDPSVGLGVEAILEKMLVLRAGYKSGQDEGSGFALGMGMKYLSYSFDFAYQPFGDLGNSYYLSVGAGF